MRHQPVHRRSLLRTFRLWVFIAAGLLAACVAAAALGWAFLKSQRGEAWLAQRALRLLEPTSQGQWAVQRVSLHGLSIRVDDLSLTDRGQSVLQVDHGEAQVALWPLLHREIRLRASVRGLRLSLEQGPSGLGLAKALSPRAAMRGGARPRRPWVLLLSSVEVQQGAAIYRSGSRVIALEPFAASGSARFFEGEKEAQVRLWGNLDGEKLQAQAQARARPGELDATASAISDESELQAKVSQREAGPITLDISALRLSPALLQKRLPSWPLKIPVQGRGELQLSRGWKKVQLWLRAGEADVRVFGTQQESLVDLEIQADGLRAQSLFGKGDNRPRSARILAQGNWIARTGHLRVESPGLLLAQAELKPKALRIQRLSLTPPGAKAQFHGQLTLHRLDLEGSVDAKDLGALSAALRPLVPGFPLLEGAWLGAMRLSGPWRALSLVGEGQLSKIAVGPLRGEQVRASIELPNLNDPFQIRTRIQGARLNLWPLQIRHLEGQLNATKDTFTLQFGAPGEGGFSLLASGTRNRSLFNIQRLDLHTQRSHFRLQKPARLRLSEELSVSPLVLRAGPQTIRFYGKKTRARLSGALQLSSVQVYSPAFEGRVNADLRAAGSSKRPSVDGWVQLRSGRIRSLSGVQLNVLASVSPQHTRGELEGWLGTAKAQARWDLPLTSSSSAARASAAVQGLTARQLRALGWTAPKEGSVDAKLSLEGTGADPRVSLQLWAKQLEFRRAPPVDGRLEVASGEEGQLYAQAEVTLLGRRNAVFVQTPFTLAQLRRGLPGRRELLRSPFRVVVDARAFPLPVLYTAGFSPELVTGTLSAQLDLQGPLRTPKGQARIAFAGFSRAGSPLLKGQLSLEGQPSTTSARLIVERQETGAPLIDLRAELQAPLTEPLPMLEAVPVRAAVEIQNLGLNELRALLAPRAVLRAPSAGELVYLRRAPLLGTLHLSGDLRGTLSAPRLNIRADLSGVGTWPARAVGNVAVAYRYEQNLHTVQAWVRSQNGGSLHLEGRTQMDASLPAILGGLSPGERELVGSLEAHQLDLAFASGLLHIFRQTGGLLEAQVQVRGVLARPAFAGTLEVHRGQVSIAGLGTYRDLELLVRGTQEHFAVEKLFFRAGQGSGTLTAVGEERENRMQLKAAVTLDRFPAISDDQLRATVTGRAHAEGELHHRIFDFTRVVIDEAQVLLPSVPPRSTQPLDEPLDVVYSRSGVLLPPDQQPQSFRHPAPKERQSLFRMYLRAYAPQKIFIRGQDLEGEVALSDGYTVKLELPTQMYGDIRVLRGRLDVYGRRFQLAPGSRLRFHGRGSDPDVDATAVYADERDQIKISIKVGGTLRALTLQPSSEPPMSEQEIYSVLTTGRRLPAYEATAAATTEETASFVGALFATQLARQVAPPLPLDVLTVEAGPGTGTTAGTKLEAGRHINRRLYVGYEGRVGANTLRGENRNAVRLEYQFSRHWSFDGTFGDALSGSADLLWSREY